MFDDFLLDIGSFDYGEDLAKEILAGSQGVRLTTLRANTIKATAEEIAQALQNEHITFSKAPWYKDAFILEDATYKNLAELEIFKNGKIYIQSLSSMLPPLVIDPRPGQDILDMCAAPGGKTTQMASLGGKGCNITACEMHMPRAEKLRFNLQKQGANNVTVMQTDARRLDEFFRFDKILLDAPCSGSGTLNVNNEKQSKGFTNELIDKCCKQQKALLAKALELLKPGGTLVYSTCSVIKRENEKQVEAAINFANNKKNSNAKFEIKPIEIENLDATVLPSTIDGAITICPNELYEGFFMCKITRTQ